MLAVFKRELASYFHTMTGYIFMAFLFVVVGIYFSAYNLSYQYSLFGYALVSAAFAMLITTPMLSMKVLAEERRQKVDQLLLTSPVPLYQIVLGKYLAMITVFAVPMLVFCLYPVILSRYGEVAWAQTYAAKTLIPSTASASFLILTCVLLAVGWILYRMTQRFLLPLLFCVVGEAVMAGVYLTHAALYEGLVQKIMDIFDISTRFSGLTDGMLDVTAIVYFLSVIAAGIFLSIQSIQKRRWS